MIKKIGVVLCVASFFSSCVAVKEYQKVNLSDRDMVLTSKKFNRFKTNFQVYREGASGANNGKSGGGCGCN